MHVVRSCLMQQEEEKQRRRQQEVERSAKYFEQQQLELTKYKDQLTQLQAAKEEKQKQMSAEINRMVADAHEKRERQKKAKMQAELREAALEAERLRLEEDKRLKALQVEQVKNMATPMGVLVAKRVEKLRLQEYENEMTQAYQKRLAAQELARKADLQKTYERQEKRVSMALLNVVSPEEKARQDEVRAAVVQAAERKKEEARLEEKRRKQRQLDAEQGQELRKQQEEKRNRLEAERQAAAHIDAMGAQDALAAEMAARVKQAKKDAIDREYRTATSSTSKVLPFLSRTPTSPPLTSDPPSLGYAQPHRNIRHRTIKPASRRTRYDTQISMIRKRTIVPVTDPRSMSLGARILHFKIAPHELQAVLKREDARKLRHITDHGTNLVARNKQLVKPPSNQVASEGRILYNQQHRATKRIQHFWRRKSQAICLSHVTHAMLVIQKYLMKWVRKNRLRRRQLAVHVIITSIEELQEAKFRRV
ncbi:hypothetical protein DYB30_001126 [Aphanomyces astaci]|uniref:Uncharacterized protein n=1 Tax=Aphanomyces astaci TaxID=112090 RepID=A0A397E0D3_APHAT|nr:hypothetical protein DYB30_001126 [Aphanomyces astaci]